MSLIPLTAFFLHVHAHVSVIVMSHSERRVAANRMIFGNLRASTADLHVYNASKIIGIGTVNTENELFEAENPGLRRCRTPSFDKLWNLACDPLGASRYRAALLTFEARSPSSVDGVQ